MALELSQVIICENDMDEKGLSCHKRVMNNQYPNGKEAKDDSFFSRCCGGGSATRRLVLRRVAFPRSHPHSVRERKSSMARLDLHARSNRMDISFAMSQPGSFLSRSCGLSSGVAIDARALALFGRDRGILIRGVMAAAAFQAGRSPWEISFKGALQTLGHFLPALLSRISSETWRTALLTAVASHIVGDRPDRFEPRLVKRRPKPYKHLREHRRNYKP
jgi:hypothetical protein